MIPPQTLVQDSYILTKSRFDTAMEASVYASKHGGHARDKREQACIAAALAASNLLPDSLVLDLPCGTGRLSPMIVNAGHRLVAADSSPHMVSEAANAWSQVTAGDPGRRARVEFEVRDVMASGYGDAAFDAVICNRLLHHFTEPATRTRALTELARVSARWVIISFFNAGAFEALRKRLGFFLIGRTQQRRVPISLEQFKADAAAAGLRVVDSYPTLGRISPQWYLLLEKVPASGRPDVRFSSAPS